jgi:serine/threonine protein phosphatase PrpC
MEDRTFVLPELPGMRDVAAFGVFDGHGGSEVAQLSVELLPRILGAALTKYSEPQNALREAFLQLDQEIRRSKGGALHGFDGTGCTANVVVALRRAGRLRLFCANCGDSRAVLSRAGVAVELSQDHRPQDAGEKRRIEAAGGFVAQDETSGRVDGTLAVSRALGDFRFKARPDLPPERQKVIAVPDVKEMPVGKCDEFVVVGTDGVFSVYGAEELVSTIGATRRAGKTWQDALHDVLERSVASRDNASLCLARFVH